MSEAARAPSGVGENITLLALFGALGTWLAGLVDDASLQQVITIATMILGKAIQIKANDWLGGNFFGLAKGLAVVALVGLGLSTSTPAVAAERGLVNDGTIDLRVLGIGKKMFVDFGVAGIGVRIDPNDPSEIDAEPTHISTMAAGCSWGMSESLLGLACPED